MSIPFIVASELPSAVTEEAHIQCKRCKIVKIPSEFYANSGRPNGKQEWCKECNRKHAREHYQKTKHKRDPEKRRALESAWRAKNRDRILETNRQWVKNNPEKVKESRKRSYAKNRDILLKRSSDCVRKRKYGITAEEFAAMLSAQGNCCAICKSDTPRTKSNWHVDHSHVTGKVRAILCNHCNVSLGMAGDSTSRLRSMIAYLEKFGEQDDPVTNV